MRCPLHGRLSGGSEGFAVSGRHSSENPIAARLCLSLKPVGLRMSISMLVRPTYALLRIWLQDRQRLSLRFAGAERGCCGAVPAQSMVPLQARIYAGSMASAAYADRMGWAAVAAVTAPPLVLAGLGLTHPDDLTGSRPSGGRACT
jgi:hypothetical protein